MPSRHQRFAIAALTGLALGLAAALAALALGRTPLADRIERYTYDWRMRLTARPAKPSEDIVLVSITDDSVRRLAPVVGRWPWPRLVHATLVDYLSRAPARVIVYDVLFTEPDVRRFDVGDQEWTGRQSDAAFADAVARAGNVVLAADAAAEPLADDSRVLRAASAPVRGIPSRTDARCVEERPTLVRPIPSLHEAARAIGHTLFIREDDGPLRRHRPFVRADGVVVPSLAMAAAHIVSPEPQMDGPCPPLIAYRGPTLGAQRQLTFQEYSFYDLFYSEEQLLAGEAPQVDPASFRDKIVVVSATASGTYEVQATPFAQGIAGGEVHANIIDALLRRRSIVPASPVQAAALTLGVGAAVGAAGALMGLGSLTALAVLMAGGLSWWGVALFSHGTWLPLATPVTAIGLAFTAQLAWRYFVEGREKRQVKRLFARYVPRDVFEQLMADPARAALGGQRRTMTVLFSDVRGFTALSERASPEELVRQLNEYFSCMVDVLLTHRGTLDKFVGDMVMGLFGAPLDDPRHADHAVEAALAMTRALDELNARWAAEGRPTLDIGIGLSTGEMVAGNIGSAAIMSYTVIGDAVNLGARLESLTKEYGVRIIVSEATRDALAGGYDIRPLGNVTVKGKSRPVAIFEVKSA